MSGGVPHGSDRAHRIRRRLRATGCLQRLLVLRGRVSVRGRPKNEHDGRAFKCTFCYDRQKAGLTPACAKACPTESIQFGEIEELSLRAQERVRELNDRGMTDARLYDPRETTGLPARLFPGLPSKPGITASTC